MWPQNAYNFLACTQLNYPIIQAPMAGVATPELIATVSQCGALGSIAAGYMPPEIISKTIQATRALTEAPFSVNLFVPQNFIFDEAKITHSKKLLQPYCQILGVKQASLQARGPEDFYAQVQVVLEQRVPLVSFTFGIPELGILQEFKDQGTLVMGTATTIEEALQLEASGVDMIVAQGMEAGGHRGTFLGPFEHALIPLEALLTAMVTKVKIPVLAAGGIMTGQDIKHMLRLGAAAVQMGTAFLTCTESSAHPLYKQSILAAKENITQLTRAFSGKPARGIVNQFMQEMANFEAQLPDYPIQHYLTQPMRQEAARQNHIEFMSLWAGAALFRARALPVSQLIKILIDEYKKS